MFWKIFMNRNNIRKIITFANRNSIYEMKLWQIGLGIYLWPKYPRKDSWQIYSQTIRKKFANRELFAEHWRLRRLQQITAHKTPLHETCIDIYSEYWEKNSDKINE